MRACRVWGFAGSGELGLGRAPPDDGVRAGIHDVEDQRPFPVLAGHHHRHARAPRRGHRPDISKGRSCHGRRLRPALDAHVPLDEEVRAARLLPVALAIKRLVHRAHDRATHCRVIHRPVTRRRQDTVCPVAAQLSRRCRVVVGLDLHGRERTACHQRDGRREAYRDLRHARRSSTLDRARFRPGGKSDFGRSQHARVTAFGPSDAVEPQHAHDGRDPRRQHQLVGWRRRRPHWPGRRWSLPPRRTASSCESRRARHRARG